MVTSPRFRPCLCKGIHILRAELMALSQWSPLPLHCGHLRPDHSWEGHHVAKDKRCWSLLWSPSSDFLRHYCFTCCRVPSSPANRDSQSGVLTEHGSPVLFWGLERQVLDFSRPWTQQKKHPRARAPGFLKHTPNGCRMSSDFPPEHPYAGLSD